MSLIKKEICSCCRGWRPLECENFVTREREKINKLDLYFFPSSCCVTASQSFCDTHNLFFYCSELRITAVVEEEVWITAHTWSDIWKSQKFAVLLYELRGRIIQCREKKINSLWYENNLMKSNSFCLLVLPFYYISSFFIMMPPQTLPVLERNHFYLLVNTIMQEHSSLSAFPLSI